MKLLIKNNHHYKGQDEVNRDILIEDNKINRMGRAFQMRRIR